MSNLSDQNSTTRSTDTVNDNTPLRKLRMEDFLDDTNKQHNKQHNKHNDINKNQEDFGHKRRIKP